MLQVLRIDNNISLEFSYTKDGTYVKVLRLGLKIPLRGNDIRVGPNSYSIHCGPQLVEKEAGRIVILLPDGNRVTLKAEKLNLTWAGKRAEK